jgi:GNAT superfamily N-acetyltransferase
MTDVDRAPARIREVTELSEKELDQLAEVLIDCVALGASVSFMYPLSRAKAQAFWRCIASDAAAGTRALLVAEDESGIVGTVQLGIAQPENQPHRADLAKLLVHPRARRRGIAAALMTAAEDAARRSNKSLLVLDTASGDAERLYLRLGWQCVGVVPGYALWPHGGLCATTFYYRRLA